MLVTGKIFICSECEKYITIEYEGGPLYTQIGDSSVYYQLEISEKIGQPNSKPEEEGFFLYDIGICSNCFEKACGHDALESNVKFFDLIDLISIKKNEYLDQISKLILDLSAKIISNLNIKDIESAIDGNFDRDFGDKYALPSKKKKLFNAFWNKNKDNFAQYVLTLLLLEDNIKQEIMKWDEFSGPVIEDLKSILRTGHKIYTIKNTEETENLNDYICAETTVRTPVDFSIKEKFYFEFEIEDENIDDFADIKCLISLDESCSILIREKLEILY